MEVLHNLYQESTMISAWQGEREEEKVGRMLKEEEAELTGRAVSKRQ